MADGLTSEIGLSVLRNVVEDLKVGQEAALTLPQNMVEQNVKERTQKTRIVTHNIALSMVDGLTLEIGLSVLRHVVEDLKVGQEAVLTLRLNMVEQNVKERTQKTRIVTHNIARLMADGLTSEIGLSALRNVVEDLKVGQEAALTLRLNMVEQNVKERTQKTRIVTHNVVRLMEDGLDGVGPGALLNVVEELKVGEDTVLTLPLKMVEHIVQDRAHRTKVVTHNVVRLMVDGLASEVGPGALLNVVEELKVGEDTVLTLPLKMVEHIVQDRAHRTKVVTHSIV